MKQIKVTEIRKILSNAKIAPWKDVFNKEIEEFTDNEIQKLFNPINNFSQAKKINFILENAKDKNNILEVGGGYR